MYNYIYIYIKWSMHDTQSAQILQKQDASVRGATKPWC